MILDIASHKSINDIQLDFNRQYPYLKVEFYRGNVSSTVVVKREHLQSSLVIKKAGLIRNGTIEINDFMKVGELEKIFSVEFGLSAQVSRKSGILWLETTMTDNWTLKQQNDHGKELSEPVKNKSILNDRSLDESDS